MAHPVVNHELPEVPPAESRGTRAAAAGAGAAFGAAVTVPAVIIAFISGGFGHGDFVAFKVLYPIPLLLANIFENLAPGVLLIGLFQFPLYGALLFMGTLRSASVLAALLVIHVLAVIACFAPFLLFIFY